MRGSVNIGLLSLKPVVLIKRKRLKFLPTLAQQTLKTERMKAFDRRWKLQTRYLTVFYFFSTCSLFRGQSVFDLVYSHFAFQFQIHLACLTKRLRIKAKNNYIRQKYTLRSYIRKSIVSLTSRYLYSIFPAILLVFKFMLYYLAFQNPVTFLSTSNQLALFRS